MTRRGWAISPRGARARRGARRRRETTTTGTASRRHRVTVYTRVHSTARHLTPRRVVPRTRARRVTAVSLRGHRTHSRPAAVESSRAFSRDCPLGCPWSRTSTHLYPARPRERSDVDRASSSAHVARWTRELSFGGVVRWSVSVSVRCRSFGVLGRPSVASRTVRSGAPETKAAPSVGRGTSTRGGRRGRYGVRGAREGARGV